AGQGGRRARDLQGPPLYPGRPVPPPERQGEGDDPHEGVLQGRYHILGGQELAGRPWLEDVVQRPAEPPRHTPPRTTGRSRIAILSPSEVSSDRGAWAGTGTGMDLVARALNRLGPLRDRTFDRLVTPWNSIGEPSLRARPALRRAGQWPRRSSG